MLAGVLGVVSFVLALFAAGAFMEGDMGKIGRYAAAFIACVVITLVFTSPKPFQHVTECITDWDGRSNSEICN